MSPYFDENVKKTKLPIGRDFDELAFNYAIKQLGLLWARPHERQLILGVPPQDAKVALHIQSHMFFLDLEISNSLDGTWFVYDKTNNNLVYNP